VGISRTGLLVWAQSIKKGQEDVEIKQGWEFDGNADEEGRGINKGVSMFLFEGVVISLFVFGSLDVIVCSYQDRFGENSR
jgi:hypothetical protein